MIGDSLVNRREMDFLTRALPSEGIMLEVGTYHGVTAATIASEKQKARIVCIDPFVKTNEALPGMIGDEEIWRKNAQPNMELFVGTLREFAVENDRLFDVVFIDGCHAYECSKDDLIAGAPLVKKGGLLLAHDYGRVKHDRVHRAVNEFVDESVWRLKAQVGTIAVLKRKSDLG
jgi:predicted O-methyltransferase YrrM